MRKFFLFAMTLFSLTAHAQDRWTILGPAVSVHQGNDGAKLIGEPRPVTTCPITKSTSGIIGLCSVSVMDGGVREWESSHPGVGIEYQPADSLISRVGSVVRDSYGQWGAMAGVGYQPLRSTIGSVSISAGAVAGLWWRTVGRDVAVVSSREDTIFDGQVWRASKYPTTATELSRAVLPFIISTISIKGSKKGFGVNLSVIPKMELGGVVVPVTTWLVQVTYTL